MRGLFFLLILGIILETVFYPYPFVLLVVIIAVLGVGSESLFFAFFAGFFLDLIGLRSLGMDSLIFLGLSALMLRYNRRIHFSNILNVMIFIVVTVTLYSLIFYQRNISISNILLTLILGFLLLFILPMVILKPNDRKKLQL